MAIELLLLAVLIVVSVELWLARARLDEAREAQQSLHHVCFAMHVTLDSAALAADHGDHDATRAVLAWPSVFWQACAGEVVDTDKLSWCWINGDSACAARELRLLETRVR